MREDGRRDTFAAFLAGAVAGGLTAILLTPKSGPELRRTISDTGARFREDAGEMSTRALETAEKKARDAADEARRALDRIKELTGSRV